MDELTVDLILSNSCSNPSPEHEGYDIYCIELHCYLFRVIAKRLSEGKYQILEYTILPN